MGVVREDFNGHDLREVAYLLFIIMNYSDYCQFPTKLYETLCRPMLYYLNVIDYIQTSALSSHEKNVQYFHDEKCWECQWAHSEWFERRKC